MDKLPTFIEVDSMTKNQLLFWIRKFKTVPVTGNKKELSDRLKALVNREIVNPAQNFDLNLSHISADFEEKRKLFDLTELLWSSDVSAAQIPSNFNLGTINSFLTSITVVYNDEELAAGTEKPAVKGRKMYASSKIQLCEFSQKDSFLLFRCNMEASMKSSVFR